MSERQETSLFEGEDALTPEYMGKTMYLVLRRDEELSTRIQVDELLGRGCEPGDEYLDRYHKELSKAAGIAPREDNLEQLNLAWQVAKTYFAQNGGACGLLSDASNKPQAQ